MTCRAWRGGACTFLVLSVGCGGVGGNYVTPDDSALCLELIEAQGQQLRVALQGFTTESSTRVLISDGHKYKLAPNSFWAVAEGSLITVSLSGASSVVYTIRRLGVTIDGTADIEYDVGHPGTQPVRVPVTGTVNECS